MWVEESEKWMYFNTFNTAVQCSNKRLRPKWNLRLLSYWTEKLQFLKSLKVMSIKQYSHFWSDGTEEKKSSFHHFKFVMIMQEISSKQINKKAVIIFTTDVECCKVQTCFE